MLIILPVYVHTCTCFHCSSYLTLFCSEDVLKFLLHHLHDNKNPIQCHIHSSNSLGDHGYREHVLHIIHSILDKDKKYVLYYVNVQVHVHVYTCIIIYMYYTSFYMYMYLIL